MRCAASAGLLLILVASIAPRVQANGGTARLAKAPAGPYLVSTWTQPDPPRVGRIDVSVAVMRPDSAEPALDVDGWLRAQVIDGGETAPRARLERGAGGNLLLYHAELEVATAGRWRVTVALEGSEGKGQAVFDLDIDPRQPLPWSVVAAAGLIILGALVWLSARAKRAKKSTPP